MSIRGLKTVLTWTHHGVSLLHDLVDGDEGLEGLDLVRHDGEDPQGGPDRVGRAVVPCVHDGLCWRADCQYEEGAGPVRAASDGRDLLRTCFCFGAVSSGLVAFFRATCNSISALSLSTGRVGLCEGPLGGRAS